MWRVPARWSRVVCIVGVSCLAVGLTHAPATAQVAQDGVTAGRPTAPCFDNINRYVNCGDGTVTDTVTGLVWLQEAEPSGLEPEHTDGLIATTGKGDAPCAVELEASLLAQRLDRLPKDRAVVRCNPHVPRHGGYGRRLVVAVGEMVEDAMGEAEGHWKV